LSIEVPGTQESVDECFSCFWQVAKSRFQNVLPTVCSCTAENRRYGTSQSRNRTQSK